MTERDPQFYHNYADALEKRFTAGLLAELQEYPQFVVWKGVQAGDKIKKLPFTPNTHTIASATDPHTWGIVHQALTALRSRAFTGIGFVFSESDPFTGIDIDKCVQERILTPYAQEVVNSLNSYAEFSPSRTGVHILVKGCIQSRRTDTIEMYAHSRFFTLTTNHVHGTPYTIEERQSQLDLLYASLSENNGYRSPVHCQEHQIFVSDETVLGKAFHARNGQKFRQLWQGNIDGYRSKSEADFTFVLMALYWTNDDIAQVARLFRQSGLYDQKTDRPTNGMTYLEYTIKRALDKRG